MKTKSFLAIFITVFEITNQLSAQDISDSLILKKSDYWNLALSAGISGNAKSYRSLTPGQIGISFNIDASFVPKKKLGFFLNYSYTFFNKKSANYYFNSYRQNYDINFSQFTFGPRFYSINENSFIDLGFGYYNLEGSEFPGFNMGVGGKIRLSDSYALIIGGRFNLANISHNPDLFYSINTGIEMNNRSENTAKDRSLKSRFSLAAFLGSFGEKISNINNNSISTEVTYDLSKIVSLLFNYLYANSEDVISEQRDIFDFYEKASFSKNSYSSGARFYIMGKDMRLFIETLAGIYFTKEYYESSTYFFATRTQNKDSFYGFTVGSGAEFKLIDDLSGIFKVDISNYITGGSDKGIFGGFKYRL